MGLKWVQNGSQMGPKWVPGGSWRGLGALGGPWGALGGPKGLQRATLGVPFFMILGGENAYKTNAILTCLIFERFWRELDRQEHRHVFLWFSSMLSVNTWGEYAYKTKLILTIPFLSISAGGVFVDAQKWVLGPEFWAPESSILMICTVVFSIFNFCKMHNLLMVFLRGAKNTIFK